MATVVVLGAGKGRRYRQNKQGSEENLLHATNVAPRWIRERGNPQRRSVSLHQERKQSRTERSERIIVHKQRTAPTQITCARNFLLTI